MAGDDQVDSGNGRQAKTGSGTRGFTGSIAFNEATGRYEANSTDGTVVGRKSGNTITFDMNSTSIQGDVTSSMSFRGNQIRVDFSLKDAETGEVSGSQVTFTRS